jgi:hypothetical protein
MTPLELRKQLLIAESNLNRVQLLGDVDGLKTSFCALTRRARSYGSIASSAAILLAGLAAFKRGKPVDAHAKRLWLQIILKAAGFLSTLWLGSRSRGQVGE